MELVVEFRGFSKRIEMERTCLENKHLSKFIDYDNHDKNVKNDNVKKASYKISM